MDINLILKWQQCHEMTPSSGKRIWSHWSEQTGGVVYRLSFKSGNDTTIYVGEGGKGLTSRLQKHVRTSTTNVQRTLRKHIIKENIQVEILSKKSRLSVGDKLGCEPNLEARFERLLWEAAAVLEAEAAGHIVLNHSGKKGD